MVLVAWLVGKVCIPSGVGREGARGSFRVQ